VSLALSLFLLAFVFSALCSGAETGFYALNSVKLRHAARDSASVRLLLRIIRSPAGFLATLLVANNIANDLLVQTGIILAENLGVEDAAFWSALALMPIAFIFCDMLPKQWMAVHAETSMPALAWPLAIMRVLLWPIAAPLIALARALGGGSARSAVLGRLEWAELLREGERSHPGEARAMRAALGALESRGSGLTKFLRPQLTLVPAGASREDALRALAAGGLGFLVLQQPGAAPSLLTGARLLQSDPNLTPAQLARPLLQLDPHTDLADAFRRLREAGMGLAWVGGTPGGLLDLEYALSLLAAPPTPPASLPKRP
jgi:hypothetical protein